MTEPKARDRLHAEVTRTLAAIPDETDKLLRGFEFAKKYSQIGDYVNAEKYVSKYLSARNDNAAAWRLSGEVNEKASKWSAALTAYKRSYELDTLQTDLLPKICDLYREVPDNQLDADAQNFWKLASEAFKDDLRVRALEMRFASIRSRGVSKKPGDFSAARRAVTDSPQPKVDSLQPAKPLYTNTYGTSPVRTGPLDFTSPRTQRTPAPVSDNTLQRIPDEAVEDVLPPTNGGRAYERALLEQDTMARLVETITRAQTTTFREFATTFRDELAASREGDALRREVEAVRREMDTVRRELDATRRERDERPATQRNADSLAIANLEQQLRTLLDRTSEVQSDVGSIRERQSSFSKELQGLRSELWQTFAPLAVFVNSLSQFVPGTPQANTTAFRTQTGLLPTPLGAQPQADVALARSPVAPPASTPRPAAPANTSSSPQKPNTTNTPIPTTSNANANVNAPKPTSVFGSNLFGLPGPLAPAATTTQVKQAQPTLFGQAIKPVSNDPAPFGFSTSTPAPAPVSVSAQPKSSAPMLADILSQPAASSTNRNEPPNLNFVFSQPPGNLAQPSATKAVPQPAVATTLTDAAKKPEASKPVTANIFGTSAPAANNASAKPFSGFSFGSVESKQQLSTSASAPLFSFGKPPATSVQSAPKVPETEEHEHDAEDDNPSDFEPQVEFTPLVTLPSAVDTRTGEEEEQKLFGERAKLYRFDAESKSWKERGIGELKLLHHAPKNTYRLLMRREQVLKICLNHYISAAIDLHPFADTDRKALIWVAQDFSEGELRLDRFAVRFKSEDVAAQFKQAIEDAKKRIASRPAQASAPTTAPPSGSTKTDKTLDKFKPAAGSWQCSICALFNDAAAENCKACQTANPVAARPAQAPAPAPTTSGSTKTDKTLDKFKPAAGSWQCSVCALFNDAAEEKCKACQTANPKPKAKPDAPPAADTPANLLAPARFSVPTAAQKQTDAANAAAQPANTFGHVFGKLQTGVSLFSGAAADKPNTSTTSLFGNSAAAPNTSTSTSMSNFSFKLGASASTSEQPSQANANANTKPSPFASFSFASKNAETKAPAASKPKQSGDDEDVVFLRTVTATAEQRERARRFGLPDHFYAFENELAEERAQLGVVDLENFNDEEGQKLQQAIDATKRHQRVQVKSEKDPSEKPKSDKAKPKGDSQTEPFILGQGSKTSELSFANLAQQSSGASLFQLGSSTSSFTFGTASNKPSEFKFAGAGQPLFGAAMRAATTAQTTPQTAKADGDADADEADEEEPNAEHECTAEFKPVLTALPELVACRTGEEDDLVLFSERARLYHFVNREWKERGIGNIKVSQVRSNGRIRLLLRREQVHKLAANHYLSRAVVFTEMATANRVAFSWQAVDSSIEPSSPEDLNKPITFSIRFKNEQQAAQFIATIRSLQAEMKQRDNDMLPLRDASGAPVDAPVAKPSDSECKLGQAAKQDAPALTQLLTGDAEQSQNNADGDAAQDAEDDQDDQDDEEDSVMFNRRATLFAKQDNDFKKIGLGDLRIIYDSELYLARILLRNEQKTLCDCIVTSQSQVNTAKHGRSFDVEFTAEDANASGNAQPLLLSYRASFASQATQSEFVDQFQQGIECARGAEVSDVADADTTEISRPEITSD